MNIHENFLYKGCQVRQPQEVSMVMMYFLGHVQPAQVLEIGTFTGGLTLILRDTLDLLGLDTVPLRTYDIMTSAQGFLDQHPNRENIDFIVKNMWSDFKELDDPSELEEFIQRDGPTIVLCDGGNKPREFRTIAPLLKDGDYILGHDYAPNDEYFNKHVKNKIWNWCELDDTHVMPVVEENGLILKWPEFFQRAAWFCAQKGV